MKILYVTQMYPSAELPQYCAFLHNQVKAMQGCGAELSVVVPSVEKPTGHTVYDGVDVFYLSYRDISRTAFAPLVYFRLKKELKRMLRVKDYDIVYAIHAPVNILYFAQRLAKANGLPFIVHYRGYNIFTEFEGNQKAFLSNPEKAMERIVQKTDLSLGVSKKTVAVITDRFPHLPVETVYNGINHEIFNGQTDCAPHEGIRILCVANLIPIKGHKYLFDAFRQLLQQYPEKKLQLDIVGRGPSEAELKAYVETNKIENINFYGYIPHEQVSEMMRNTDIFVLPSVYEAFANVCLEAMACKKPIVIFEGQGIDEVLTDGVNAMIAEKANGIQLKEKIEFLINNPKKRAEIAENGYLTAQSFSWQKSGEKLVEIIERVICKNANQRCNSGL